MKTFEKIKIASSLAVKNPGLFWDYAAYRMKRLTPRWRNLNLKTGTRNIDGVQFEVDFETLGSDYFPKQMYFGCYSIALVRALQKILRPGDVFFDVGANVGYISAVGASLVGQRGQVHCFEPVPLYAEKLRRLASMNPDL